MVSIKALASIQYVGLDGVTESCLSALSLQLSRMDEMIQKAVLITCNSSHAFLLFTEYGAVIAVKTGFRSGYRGEGPQGLAVALELIQQHEIDLEEFVVDESFFIRLERSALLEKDVGLIENGRPVRPKRLYDYIHGRIDSDFEAPVDTSRHYASTIPFHLIDQRIKDIAVRFRANEDRAIFSAFRRLEEIVRERTGLSGEGAALFARAFHSDPAVLTWDLPDKGEIKGRASLFGSVYMAFRNARAHREVKSSEIEALREFLLVNELYRLESEAMTPREIELKRKEEDSMKNAVTSLNRK